MSRTAIILLSVLSILTGGCGYGSKYMGGNGAPTIMSLNPNTVTAGNAAFPLTVTGTGFGTDSVVFWNGNALPSTYGSGTSVTAQVSATDVMTSGMFPVYVQ